MDIRCYLRFYLHCRSGNFQRPKLSAETFSRSHISPLRYVMGAIVSLLALTFLSSHVAFAQEALTSQERPFAVSCTEMDEGPKGDCEILIETGWWDDEVGGEITSHCDFSGVTCKNGRVSEIRLTGRSSNSIPISLTGLTELKYLRLSSMSFQNNIPPELGNFAKLEHMDLSHSQLIGTVPSELGNLSKLTWLDLSNNQLDGAIPLELANLSFLEYLNLSDNRLTGTIPSELGKYNFLRNLTLTRNGLEGAIPESLGNLENLGFLYLDKNQLRGEIPASLSQIPRLNNFSINYNALPIPTSPILRNYINARTPDWASTQTIEPTELAATIDVTGAISLTWEPILYQEDPGFYEISYRVNPDGLDIVHGSTTDKFTNSYLVDNLLPEQTYHIRIRTHTYGGASAFGNDNNLWSEYSKVVTVTTPPLSPTETVTPTPTIPPTAVNTSQPTAQPTAQPTSQPATTVTPPSPENVPLYRSLVMIYAVLDNNLDEYRVALMNKIRAGTRKNKDIVVWVMIDAEGDGNAKLYKYKQGTQNASAWFTENTATDESLQRFLEGGLAAYPDVEMVALSLIGHGGGWGSNFLASQPTGIKIQAEDSRMGGMLWDDTTGREDGNTGSLSTVALGNALKGATENMGRTINMLYLDACSMGSIEVAYELEGYVDYLLASPNTAWATLPYDELLSVVSADLLAQDIGQRWLEIEMRHLDHGDYPSTLSLVDVSKLSGLRDAIDNLAEELTENLSDYFSTIQTIFHHSDIERFESNYDGKIDDHDSYIELGSLIERVKAEFADNATIVASGDSVLSALNQSILQSRMIDGYPWRYTQDQANLDQYYWSWTEPHISIYAPMLYPEVKRRYYTHSNLRWTLDGKWPDFVDKFWQNEADISEDEVTDEDIAEELAECNMNESDACAGLDNLASATELIRQPQLRIPAYVPGVVGETAHVLIEFDNQGLDVASMIFEIDYDESCLSYDGSNWHGLLDEVFTTSVEHEPDDSTGELNVTILPKSTISSINDINYFGSLRFLVREDCDVLDSSTRTAHVNFSSATPASFGSVSGTDIPGITVNGFIEVEEGMTHHLGDCNGDDAVDAADFICLAKEIFDKDSPYPIDALALNSVSHPGVDANRDGIISAGDAVCIALIIFGSSCGSDTLNEPLPDDSMVIAAMNEESSISTDPMASSEVGLTIEVNRMAEKDEIVKATINLVGDASMISSAVYAIDYDSDCLALHIDEEGEEDIINTVPPPFINSVNIDLSGNQIGFATYHLSPSPHTISSGPLATIGFRVICESGRMNISFANNPPISFGDLDGQSIAGADSPENSEVGLTIEVNETAKKDDIITAKINLRADESMISSAVYAIDYDSNCLALHIDEEGEEDIINAVPPPFINSVDIDLGGNQIGFATYHLSPNPHTISPSLLATIGFKVLCESGTANIRFANNPPISFGDLDGQSIAGAGANALIQIVEIGGAGTRENNQIYLPTIYR